MPAAQQAEVTAPESEATAATETEVAESPEAERDSPTKTFTQEELDQAISKRLAREQRKWERERAQEKAQPQTADVKPEQFASTDEYVEALAERKAQEKLHAQAENRRIAEAEEKFSQAEEAAREKYDDYEDVVTRNYGLHLTPLMADVIKQSDIGADIAYHLGSHPKESDRIAKLPPLLQAKEIGKLEAKLVNAPPEPTKLSKAPPPISPVKAKSSSVTTYDLDDPRSYEQLGPDGWLAAQREKKIKELRARK